MTQENVEVVRRAVDAFARGTSKPCGRGVTRTSRSTGRRRGGLEAGVYRGYEEAEAFLGTFHETFERITVEVERFIESGDLVLVPNTTRLVGRDGIETAARSCTVYELREGRIAHIRLYQETQEALEAVGLQE